MRAHTIFNCDKCGKVPVPNAFGVSTGHFVVLVKLPNGSYGDPRVNAGKNFWTFTRLGAKLKKGSIAVCRECLIGASSRQNGPRNPAVLDAEIVEPSVTD